MTTKTINRALAKAESGDSWTITGRIVCRHIFFSSNGSKLLTELIVDADGNAFELKTWSETKAFTVYRKFGEDEVVQCTSVGAITMPDRDFSGAKGQHHGQWYLDDGAYFKFKNYFNCFSNLEKYQQASKRPASIAGVFISLSDSGPYARGVQGRYLKLMDEDGRIFQVLVWIPNFDYNKQPIINCEEDSGRIVLIPYAREQEKEYKTRTYTLTTTYPPVVDSECINPKVKDNLKYAWRNIVPSLAESGYFEL